MRIARVAGLWRYPVKSMAAEALEEVHVSYGLAGDRRWAFVRPAIPRSGFPWLTIRERPEMTRHRPYFRDPRRPDASSTIVRTPAGEELDVIDPALARKLGDRVRVIKQDVGVFDSMPLSLLTTQALAGLGELAGADLDPLRFRPNLLIDAAEDAAFPEDRWCGAVLRIGDLLMRVDRRDERCVVVNVDPATTERDPKILRAIARERDACLGVYGTTVKPGRVAIDDAVYLDSPQTTRPRSSRTPEGANV